MQIFYVAVTIILTQKKLQLKIHNAPKYFKDKTII